MTMTNRPLAPLLLTDRILQVGSARAPRWNLANVAINSAAGQGGGAGGKIGERKSPWGVAPGSFSPETPKFFQPEETPA